MKEKEKLHARVLEQIRDNKDRLQNISVCGRTIGDTFPAFVVAEAACNHMCDMNLARKMIDEAVKAGADAIKFQTYRAEDLVTRDAVAFWGQDKISQMEYYKRLDRFGKDEYRELFKYAEEKDIIAFSSPFDEKSTQMLADIGMPLFKIASCEIPNLRSLRHIASVGKPIMLSTGASSAEEVDRAIDTIFSEGNFDLMLLACTLSYPTSDADANLMRIRTLKERYPGLIIGFSDHTQPDPHMVIPSLAVSLGARIIEKHYTLDRTMTGSGHFFAVDPENLKDMVDNIRLAQTVLGEGELGIAPSEKKAWQSARRSVVAECPVKKGQVLTSDMIGIKRPSGGLPADMVDHVVGKKTLCDIAADEQIRLDMLGE